MIPQELRRRRRTQKEINSFQENQKKICDLFFHELEN